VIDTLRADHLSCYGHWRETSPHIDALARRGVRFEQAIAGSSWTSPSMIGMLTGQRVSRRRFDLPEEVPTLAELFLDAGYRTGAWVSNPLLKQENGFRRGFQRWVRDSLREVDEVVEWLHARRAEDTFTWVHFTDPHDPYKPPRERRGKTAGRLRPGQAELLREAAAECEEPKDYAPQREFILRQVGLYDDEVVEVDRKLGRLLAQLEEDGNLERAVVVVTADHGECLWQRRESAAVVAHRRRTSGEPTRLEHVLKQTHGSQLHQELVRVPLVVAAPGLAPGGVEEGVAGLVNLAPTILDLAGIEVDGREAMVGASLFGEGAEAGAYAMTNQAETFVAADGWKLILPTAEGRDPYGHVLQLYDLGTDPGELENLADEHPERVEALRRRIEERRRSALPLPKAGSWEEQTRANAEALRALGYADAGIVDLEEGPGPPASPPSPEKGAGGGAARAERGPGDGL